MDGRGRWLLLLLLGVTPGCKTNSLGGGRGGKGGQAHRRPAAVDPRVVPDTPAPDAAHVWKYPLHRDIVTTYFWCGEGASAENGYISNVQSAWDGEWTAHYGGIDTPHSRDGVLPAGFTPKENPFYFALPYNDLDDDGKRKREFSRVVYWASARRYGPGESALKNRWIQVTHGSTTCYGQWEDVGPYHEDDAAYVFGAAPPKNKTAPRAGLDVSPALRDCLGLDGTGRTSWRFVEADEVPPGPWKTTITTSNTVQ